MALHPQRRRVMLAVAAGLLVAGHVLVGTVGVAAAARWLGAIAVGVLATVLVVLHVLAARRLIKRRRQGPGGPPLNHG